ncbi:hypothetical protein Lalb_Chr07g0180361 [Lupinus albus]|uniref:CASP-like protein n=1 Tax=Lupinus albus TaxID=3870 RepID=A0A6A4Q7C2_LUPAL|nr:hypothetical protein Lalb_Chr07g0180361 [Lupinus albus]
MEFRMARGEVYLRISTILVLVLAACLIAFDTETKVIVLTIEKKVTYKDVNALKILVYITSLAAGYNMLQLCKQAYSGSNFRGSYISIKAWLGFPSCWIR